MKKLLSIALPAHDANLAWLDGQAVRYLKLERTHQRKRHHLDAPLDWPREVRQAWGGEALHAEDIVFNLDPGALPAALRTPDIAQAFARLAQDEAKALPLPPELARYLGVTSGWLMSHHHAHALSSWMLEGEDEVPLRIVIDGLGDGRPWSVYRDGRLVARGDIQHGSIGWGMREAGKLLGIQAGHFNDIAGKLMGLQSHGRVDAAYLSRLQSLRFEQIKDLWSVEPWLAHCGDPLVGRLRLLDWAATVHQRQGELLLDFFRRHADPQERIAYSGGVAQNVAWNALLHARFPRLVVPPHASDEGLSLGGLEWLRRQHGLPRLSWPGFPFGQSDAAVPAPAERTIHQAAQLLAQGRVLGWYQGHGEVGPRALGHRSILVDPRLPKGREILNRIKRREPYRPFGASVLAEHFDAHFEGGADAFMLQACRVRDPAALPAITHVDGSSRVQRVDEGQGLLRSLLAHFHALSGCPVLAHTSLNLAGKPLAAWPENARQLFLEAPLDALVIGDELLLK